MKAWLGVLLLTLALAVMVESEESEDLDRRGKYVPTCNFLVRDFWTRMCWGWKNKGRSTHTDEDDISSDVSITAHAWRERERGIDD